MILLLLVAVSLSLSSAQLAAAQHAALMAVWDAANCPPTDINCPRFDASSPCPADNTIAIQCIANDVVYLNWPAQGFNGTLSSAIGKLTALTRLSLEENRHTGELPSELGELTNMQWLSLQGNRFRGTIPDALKRLTALTELRLSRNNFTGTVPAPLAPGLSLRGCALEEVLATDEGNCLDNCPRATCACFLTDCSKRAVDLPGGGGSSSTPASSGGGTPTTTGPGTTGTTGPTSSGSAHSTIALLAVVALAASTCLQFLNKC